MELSVIKSPGLVVAIDVGSTYSGYAWQWRTDFLKNKGNVEFNTNWGPGTPQIHKTDTALLLKDNSEEECGLQICAFGYRAEKRYADICSDDEEGEKHSYHLFKKFKVLLYRLKEGDDETCSVEDSNGRHRKLSDVMKLFIKALHDDFLERNPTARNTENVLWVLTVPAIWSEKAKQFMRKAAEKAGIPRKHLLLASEPESAAIYCLNLPIEQQAAMNNIGTPGHCFLTVDLGGGTADLSAVQVQDDGLLRELCGEQGNMVGGQSVNEAFFQECNDSFEGKDWTAKFSMATPFEMMTIEHEFEKSKLAIGSEEQDEKNRLNLPKSIRDSLRANTIKLKPEAPIAITKDEELQFKTSYIKEQLFDQTCKLINRVIDKVLERQSGIQTVVLVGGFAESHIVQHRIQELLQQKYPSVKVVVPTSPFRAVLMGAVLYGHDMFIFRSRISRATYGVETNVLFDATKHDHSKKWFYEEKGEYYCKDVFDVHVEKGQSVILNEQTGGKTYVPIFESQTQISLNLIESYDPGPTGDQVMYTSQPSCKKVGEITVELTNTNVPVAEREVCVKMIYGGTQLSVIATEATTGQEYNAEIDFNC